MVSGTPTPDEAQNPADFMSQLRRLKGWSGLSYRQMSRQARLAGDHLPASTIATILGRDSLPRVELVGLLARACGLPPQEVERWVAARRRLTTVDGEASGATPRAANTATVAPAAPVLRQLPAAPHPFAGRRAELSALSATEPGASSAEGDEHPRVVVVMGAAGMGKTWLALRWAYDNLAAFPDGQLYVNLRGFHQTEPPLPSSAALHGFLVALGVPADAIPTDLDARSSLYRSLTADRRMLVLLDNARNTAQVVPLIPGGSGCTVVVTSRDRLTGLVAGHAARPVVVSPLPVDVARDVLAGRLGADRLAADPAAVHELLDVCGGLPLALGLVSAWAAVNQDFPLATLLKHLRDAPSRLDALEPDDATVDLRGVLSASYQALDPDARRMFRLLGLVPGPDFAPDAAASLAGLPLDAVSRLLRRLTNLHLIEEHRPQRFRIHDLTRAYAEDVAGRDCSPPERTAAARRLVDHYLALAHAADRRISPQRPTPPGLTVDEATAKEFADPAAALAWLLAEYPALNAAHILAGRYGHHSAVWQLAWALDTYRHRFGHVPDNVAAWRAALEVAHQQGDRQTSLTCRRLLGNACSDAGLYDEAIVHLRAAARLADDTAELALLQRSLAWTWARQGNDAEALAEAERALTLCRALNDPIRLAEALNAVGWYQALVGDLAEAKARCHEAHALFREHGEVNGQADALDSLGYIAYLNGQHAQALRHYSAAQRHYRAAGNRYQEAQTLDRIAQARAALQGQRGRRLVPSAPARDADAHRPS